MRTCIKCGKQRGEIERTFALVDVAKYNYNTARGSQQETKCKFIGFRNYSVCADCASSYAKSKQGFFGYLSFSVVTLFSSIFMICGIAVALYSLFAKTNENIFLSFGVGCGGLALCVWLGCFFITAAKVKKARNISSYALAEKYAGELIHSCLAVKSGYECTLPERSSPGDSAGRVYIEATIDNMMMDIKSMAFKFNIPEIAAQQIKEHFIGEIGCCRQPPMRSASYGARRDGCKGLSPLRN